MKPELTDIEHKVLIQLALGTPTRLMHERIPEIWPCTLGHHNHTGNRKRGPVMEAEMLARAIYEKFGCTRRVDAVNAARRLGFLEGIVAL